MAFFEWKDEYSVGIHRIDVQHMEIIRLMNDLFDAIKKDKQDTIIKNVFVELLKYANYHFGLELKMFDMYHYDKEEIHKTEHEYFIEEVKKLMIRDYLENNAIAIETLHFLRGWFEKHMMITDMEYCRYFAQKKLMDEIENYIKSEDENYYIKPKEI